MRCWRIASGRGWRPSATSSPTSRSRIAIPRQDLPSLTFRAEDAETVRYFPEKLPIGLDPDGRTHIFLYLLTQDVPIDFRGFLERHAELLRALPAWTVRLLVPCHKADAIPIYQAAFREQLGSPLRPAVLDDLRWYFHARRTPPRGPHERFDQAVRAFGAPRFQALYRAWLEARRAGVRRDVVADVGRRRGSPDGPVGVSCSAASLRASRFPWSARPDRPQSRKKRGKKTQGGFFRSMAAAAPVWAAPLATRIRRATGEG